MRRARATQKRPSRTKAVVEEELAACIAIIFGWNLDDRKIVTAEQIRSTVEFDHNIPHAIGGAHVHHNLTPRQILDHREKTAKVDIPQIAKTDRITESQAEFQRKMLAKSGRDEAEPEPTRKPKAKIQSRGFQQRPDGMKYNWGSKTLSGKKET